MNATIALITLRAMLGRRRVWLLLALPMMLLALAVALVVTGNTDTGTAAGVLERFALATLLPLLALIAGTGVIGPEIDDGQIMYILTKPIPRHVVVVTKLAVAIGLVTVFAVVPTVLAGMVLVGDAARLTSAFAAGTLAAGIAYTAVFVALAVAVRNAVTVGLLYALVWESLLGAFVPGARSLSIQDWGLSVADAITSASAVHASVRTPAAVLLLVCITVLATVAAAMRLRTVTVTGAE